MRNQYVALLGAALLVTGCATTEKSSTGGEDKNAAAKSQVYLEGATSVLPTEARSTCAIPSGSEKPQLSNQAGPSKDWKDLVARANACVAEKKWAMLEQVANLIARNDMDSPWGAYFHSIASEGMGDHSRAMWMIDLAQKKAGGRSALFHYQRGHVQLTMGETSKAMVDIEKALGVDASFLEGHLFLAEIYHRDQQLDKASKHYAGVLAVDGKHYRALTGMAETKLRQGNGSEAVDFYQKAVSAYPQQSQPWVRLAYIFETVQKNPAQALATYKSLKSGLESGSIKGPRPEVDLGAKIKSLEQAVQPRVPAQANAEKPQEAKRSKK